MSPRHQLILRSNVKVVRHRKQWHMGFYTLVSADFFRFLSTFVCVTNIHDNSIKWNLLLYCRLDMTYEAVRQIYAKFSGSSELWKVSVAHLDFLLRGQRLYLALSLVEDLIVGKCIDHWVWSRYFCTQSSSSPFHAVFMHLFWQNVLCEPLQMVKMASTNIVYFNGFLQTLVIMTVHNISSDIR